MSAESAYLLDHKALEVSAVVANNSMNRERDLHGSNGYDVELRLDPYHFLCERLQEEAEVYWLDVCCGTGRALLQAERKFLSHGFGEFVHIEGIDLVDYFAPQPPATSLLTLTTASIHDWQPPEGRRYDLITCVHGLHYLGDKLGVLERLCRWLKPGGQFAAHLDLQSLCWEDGRGMSRTVARHFRKVGLDWDARRHLLKADGHVSFENLWEYLGADDSTGPNYTGQPAVSSFYRR